MPRLKACKSCGDKHPRDELLGPMRDFCSVDCGYALAREKTRQRWAKEAREYRATERNKKATMKDRKAGPAVLAQRAVNAFVVIRDNNQPCIVHGIACPNMANGWDAGHFQGVGRSPELRFNTFNIHRQCSTSNRGAHNRKRYRVSVDQLYELNLVDRIGADRVAWLKGPHDPKHYREADFARIARIFRRRARHYKKLRGIE